MLDIILEVEVKDQNMVKHPAGIYHIGNTKLNGIQHEICIQCRNPMVNSQGMLVHVLHLNLHL